MRTPVGDLALFAAVEDRFASAALFQLIKLGRQSLAMVAGGQEVDLDDCLGRIVLDRRHDAQSVQLEVHQLAFHKLKYKISFQEMK